MTHRTRLAVALLTEIAIATVPVARADEPTRLLRTGRKTLRTLDVYASSGS